MQDEDDYDIDPYVSSGDHCADLKFTLHEFIKDIKNNIIEPLTKEDYEKYNIQIDDEDLLLVEFWFRDVDEEDLMQHFIQKVLPHAKKLRARKWKDFMDKPKIIFQGLPDHTIGHLCDLLENENIVDTDDQTLFFDYFISMIESVEEYKKNE